MGESRRRIRWHRPSDEQRERMLGMRAPARDLPFESARAASVDAEVATLLAVGVPIPDGVTSAKDLALELLKLAAEVEHALMAQYLYAATSIDLTDQIAEAHERQLLNIAIEEMGHLATVQNLLLLVGGRADLHLERDLYRQSSEQNPLPFRLEPVRHAVLAKCVVAEMPAEVPAEMQARIDQLVATAEQDAGVELGRAGAIYTLLKWVFMPATEARQWIDFPDDIPLPPSPHLIDADLRPIAEVQTFEAAPDEWPSTLDGFVLETPHTCADAVIAIEKIATQGEGLGAGDHSHFIRFLELVDAFEAGQIKSLGIARSPTLGGGYGGEDGEIIDHPYSAEWGTVFSLQYTLLILTLLHAIRTPRNDETAALRQGLVALALRGMRTMLIPLSRVCTTLPMHQDAAELAGPPYDLDPTILRGATDGNLPQRHLDVLDRLALAYGAIETSPMFAQNPSHAAQVANLRAFDKRRRTLLTSPTPTN